MKKMKSDTRKSGNVMISPSLFQFKEAELADAVRMIPNADFIHIDVTDGDFVHQEKPSLFYDTSNIRAVLANTNIQLDVHLMVMNPLRDLEKYAALYPKPKYISFHIESKSNPLAVIEKIRSHGIKPAIALNPATPLSDLNQHGGLLAKVDMVLLMSVVPGLPGQSYIPEVTDKIAELRGMIFEQGLDTLIEVDGGIKLKNVHLPKNAGVDVIVAGTGVFSNDPDTPFGVIEMMKKPSPLVIASDHGGYELKDKLLRYLRLKKIEYKDFGCYDAKTSVNYPEFADKVASAVRKHEYGRGILICGTGIGISIRANRYSGIRATLCYDKFTAEMSRKHNNSNVLVLGGRTTCFSDAKKIFDIWYTTAYEGGRHQKRVAMLDAPLLK